MDFKKECPDVVVRKKEFNKIRFAYPNMIPLVLESSDGGMGLSNNKYLVPKAYSFLEFQFSIRKKMKLSKNRSVYFLVGKKHVPTSESSMLALYKEMQITKKFIIELASFY